MEFVSNISQALSGFITAPESILEQIEAFGSVVYIFLFIVSFFESFIFTGLLLPGSALVAATGFIASNGVLDLWILFWITSTGAIFGDIANFYLGRIKGEKLAISISERFKLKTDYLKLGEDFFTQHGDKSIFIGRFAALIRPFIPFVAGVFKMRFGIFLFWNVLSGLAWAGAYLAIGYFFGSAFKTIAAWSGRVGIIVFIFLIICLSLYFAKRRREKEIPLDIKKL